MTEPAATVISHDYIVSMMVSWLSANGYQCGSKRLGTRYEIDIEATRPFGQGRLVVDCRGEDSSQSGQDTWSEITQAFFYLIQDTEESDGQTRFSMALPDTSEFRRRMAGMKEFCLRQGIDIFWIDANGRVRQWINDLPDDDG